MERLIGFTAESVIGMRGIRSNDEAGANLAGLYSLVATCEANDVNPLAYLEDVLIRVHTHPNSRIDELLPHNWHGPPPAEPDEAA